MATPPDDHEVRRLTTPGAGSRLSHGWSREALSRCQKEYGIEKGATGKAQTRHRVGTAAGIKHLRRLQDDFFRAR